MITFFIDIDKSINEQLRIEEENNFNLCLSIPIHESVDSIDFNKYIRSYKIDTKLGRY